jgi:hypothetical protein
VITADSLSALAASRAGSLSIPFTSSLAGPLGAASPGTIPLDPFTGLPLITSGVQIELIAARALYAYNLQVIAALRGEDSLGLGFTATSLASVNIVEALIQGAGFEDAGRAAGPAAPYASWATGSLGDVLGVLLDYFSPAASALRLVGYGAALIGGGGAGEAAGGSGGGGLSDSLLPALAYGSRTAGSGAPSAVLIALQRTESFSLQALDLHAEGYSLPGVRDGKASSGGYGTLALSTLNVDYTSESSLFAVYFGPGADVGGDYQPLNLYA